MPTGWSEFLERVKQQSESEEPVNLHALWSDFLQQSKVSPRAEALQLLAQIVQKAPIDQRLSVAALLASLLEQLEWPPEWERHRPPLLEALSVLVTTVRPARPDSLINQLGLTPESTDMMLASGGFMLACAAQLLSTCRRDELPTVARICDVGLNNLVESLRLAFTPGAKQPMGEALLQARMRFDAALDRYAQAARALNSATGKVLFTNLDMRLGGPET